MKAINIEWDVDDKSELWDLPTEIEIPEDIEGDKEKYKMVEQDYIEIANHISNTA